MVSWVMGPKSKHEIHFVPYTHNLQNIHQVSVCLVMNAVNLQIFWL